MIAAPSSPKSDDGSFAASATSRSLNAKRLRMLAATDVQYLANRINKLKVEENKAKKEIDQTVARTRQLVEQRQQLDALNRDKQRLQNEANTSKREERMLMSVNRENQLKAIWVAKQKLLQDRKEAVQSMRKEREINECRMHLQKEEQRDRNTKRREDIQKDLLHAKVKRERDQQQKLEQARQLFEERIAREEAERERKEQLAAKLVEQEAQLLYRLRRLQSEKQKVLQDLAKAVDAVEGDEVEEEIEAEAEELPAEVPEEC